MTSDNGREEQWEKGESFTWQLWDGDDMQTLWPVLADSRVIAVATTEADRDRLLAARAQAGLAQDIRETFRTQARLSSFYEDWCRRYDALTGGRPGRGRGAAATPP